MSATFLRAGLKRWLALLLLPLLLAPPAQAHHSAALVVGYVLCLATLALRHRANSR